MKHITMTILALVAIATAAQPAAASYGDKGFYAGLRMGGSVLAVDEADNPLGVDKNGGHLGAQLGFNFNPVFSLQLELDGSRYSTETSGVDVGLGSVRLLAMYRFRPAEQFRPYVKGGFGGYNLLFDGSFEDGDIDANAEGGGLVFGGGFDYFFSPHFALGLDVAFNAINYDALVIPVSGGSDVRFDINEGGASTEIGIQTGFYF